MIGVNGSGKTNLLTAILLLQRATRGQMRHYSGMDSEYKNKSHISAEFDYAGQNIAVRGYVHYITNNRNIDEVVGTRLKWNLANITGEKDWIELPLEMLIYGQDFPLVITHSGRRLSYAEMRKGTWLVQREMKNILPERVFPVVREVSEFLMEINYYSASQFSDPSRCPVSLVLEDGRRVSHRRRDVIDHEQFVYELYLSYKKKGRTFDKFRNLIGKNGIGLVDEIVFDEFKLPSNIIEVRSGGKTYKKERTQLVVVPTFRIDKSTLSPNQLSEGTFKTLALLFYVLTDSSRFLLLEEPEVCIHHGLLNSLITIIKEESRHKQIVISTHSDYVLDQLQPENVTIVERDNERGTKARPISKALSKVDYRALKKYLRNTGNLGEYWREGGFVDD